MSTAKNLGIWMDHASAHLIEFTTDPLVTRTIESEFTHSSKEHTMEKSENVMHNKEQHQQSEYYSKLGEVIKKYDEVILFGPTSAKTELFNTLKKDRHFANIKIEVKPADKMTENQEHAFVKEHFAQKSLWS